MSKRKVYQVSPKKTESGTDWTVKKEGGKRAIKQHKDKDEAVKHARKLAKNQKLSQLKIKDRNGKYQKEHTYGSDPEKYKS